MTSGGTCIQLNLLMNIKEEFTAVDPHQEKYSNNFIIFML